MATAMIGKKAPDFQANITGHKRIKLSNYQGQIIILYFYPKDNTPGCSQQSQDFASLYQQFTMHHAIIFGISRDSLLSHEKFKAKYQLPFELIADCDETICRLYDTIITKSIFGKKVCGIERSTFLIDKQGILQKQWRKVKVKGHVAAVLAATELLSTTQK